MKKYILNLSCLISLIILSVVMINSASAQSNGDSSDALSKLTYPIAELGGCNSQADCKTYCDDSVNTAACVGYAEKKNLMSQENLRIAKKFVEAGSKGPGGCNGKNECQSYCENKTNIDECVSYAEDNGLMSSEDLQKAKKVQAAIKKGVKFPACTSKESCDSYCEESSHMEECITFAKEAGLLSNEELENTEKVLTAIKKGVNPPACKGKEACDSYCSEEIHADECTNFAVAAGLVTPEEAKIIKETGGKGPGGCKNKNECDSYCGSPDNQETCLNFAVEHKMISQEQFDQIKQGGGPGNVGSQNGGPNQGNNKNGNGGGGPGGQGGPGNNGGNKGQSGWSNGTGNGGGNGGPTGQGGGPNQGQGFNPGSGQGGGNQGQNDNPNPVKCIEDCEYTGKNCIAAQDKIGKVCASDGQYCREITCENLYTDAEGNRPTQEQSHYCNDTICRPTEVSCFDKVVANSSACTTTKDVCVMNCQKASKPAKPTQPPQPGQPNQPTKPTQPNQTSQPNQPPQSSSPPTPPAQPSQPTPPTAGYCGDGKCGKMEQANPTLCPQDCGGQ